MAKLFALIAEWMLKNTVQKVLAGAGLAVVSYLGVMVAVRASFDSLISSVNTIPAGALSLMGIYGIDHVLSSFISVAVFLLTLNSGKLAIRSK